MYVHIGRGPVLLYRMGKLCFLALTLLKFPPKRSIMPSPRVYYMYIDTESIVLQCSLYIDMHDCAVVIVHCSVTPLDNNSSVAHTIASYQAVSSKK